MYSFIKPVTPPTFSCEVLDVERTTRNDELTSVEFTGIGCSVSCWKKRGGWEGRVRIPGHEDDLYNVVETVEDARQEIIMLAKRHGFVLAQQPGEEPGAATAVAS